MQEQQLLAALAVATGVLGSALVWLARSARALGTWRAAVAWLHLWAGGARRVITTLEEHGRRFVSIEATLAEIRAELRPNGGSSLRDAVDRTHRAATVANLRSLHVVGLLHRAAFECDPDGQMSYASPALCELWGMSASEMRGKGWLRAVHDLERADVDRQWLDDIHNGRPYAREYTVVNQRTGARARVRAKADAVGGAPGEPLLYVGVIEVLPGGSDHG